jgi:hypothetical protein
MAVGTLSAARAGIQEAASQLATSSRNISRMLPQAMRASEAQQSDGAAQATTEAEPPVSLERELVHQMVALVQGKASIRVANTELELLGTLLDLKA